MLERTGLPNLAGDAFERGFAVDGIDERLAYLRRDLFSIDLNPGIWGKRSGGVQQGLRVKL